MRSVLRGLVVVGLSAFIAFLGWYVLNLLGSPTPTEPVTEIYQPALVGARHALTFLGFGAIGWLLFFLLSRALSRGQGRAR